MDKNKCPKMKFKKTFNKFLLFFEILTQQDIKLNACLIF